MRPPPEDLLLALGLEPEEDVDATDTATAEPPEHPDRELQLGLAELPALTSVRLKLVAETELLSLTRLPSRCEWLLADTSVPSEDRLVSVGEE